VTRLAVCFLTCGRHDLSRACAESFAAHNDVSDPRLQLLQADEPSMGPDSATAGRQAGFTLIHAPTQRGGQMAALRAFLAATDAPHILWLENDWNTVAPIPWEMLGKADQIRLFGAFKKPPPDAILAGPLLLNAKTRIRWDMHSQTWQRGWAHWAGGASIIRTDVLRQHANAPNLKGVIRASEPLDTLRPVGNIMVSTGAKPTKGMVF
jgi:hypothetical protein